MLKGYQKKFLKKKAHGISIATSIGKEGISETVINSALTALEANELIKVKIVVGKEIKKKVAEEIAKSTESEIVALIGFNVILFKENLEKEKRIILPTK